MMDCLLKKYLLVFLLGLEIMGFSVPSYALEHWTSPIVSEIKTLKVSNLTNQEQSLWVSGPITWDAESPELTYQLSPFQTVEIPLVDFQKFPWVHLKAQKPGLFQIMAQTKFEDSFLLQPAASTRWKGRVRPESQLVISNLAPFPQTVRLTTDSSESQEVIVPALDILKVPMNSNWTARMLTAEGSAHIAAVFTSSYNSKSLTADNTPVILNSTQNPEVHYFKVANKSDTQSFVVALTDPELIKSAKLQISNKAVGRILVANIDFGHNQTNRDLSVARKTPWSWHVSHVFRFAELASQDCDGSPEMLEENLGPWKENLGVICFWNYRVSEELTADQVATGR